MPLGLNFSRRPFKNYRPVNITVAVAGFLGILLFALNLRDYASFRDSAAGKRGEIQKLQRSAAKAEDSARRMRARVQSMRLKDLMTESTSLNTIVRERQFSWLLMLSRLERVLPNEVYITRLSPEIGPDGRAKLRLSCVGKGPDSIVKTLSALARDPQFSDATPNSETDPEKGAPEGFIFEIQVTYNPVEAAA